eukprot:05769_1
MEAFRQVDAEDRGVISRDQITLFLGLLYGGKDVPKQEEMMFTTYFETAKSDDVTYPQLLQAIQLVRARVPQTNAARKFDSYEQLKAFKHKHQRIENDPNQMYQQPVTSSQEYGWYDTSTSAKVPPNTNSGTTRWDPSTSRNRVAPQDFYGHRESQESKHAEAVYREDYKIRHE